MANARPSSPNKRQSAPKVSVTEDKTTEETPEDEREIGQRVKLPEDYVLPEGVSPDEVRRDPGNGQLYFERKSKSKTRIRTNLFSG